MPFDFDYREELARREFNLSKAFYDRKLQAGLMQYYKTRPVEWIEDWCFTYDPRRRTGIKMMPFLLFPRQKLFIQFLQELIAAGEGGLVEKCRDGGLTWLCACFAVWMWLFVPGTSIGFGSRKEILVDKIGDPDSIFEKIRIIIRMLPYWQQPHGFTPREHMTFMKLVNPATDANIKGEAGDKIGRGGRSQVYFKDESAHYERPELIEAALGDNTNTQVDISSVNGSANVFYRRRMAGEVWEPGKIMPKGKIWVFIFDWRDDPRKTQEWYDLRRERALNEGLLHVFAQEVDRDYSGSIEGIIIKPEWVRAAIDAHVKLAEWGDWFSGAHTAAQDIADGGGDRNAYASVHGVVLMHLQQWGGEAGDAARVAMPLCIQDNIHAIYYDCIGVGAGFKTEVNTMKREGSWPKSCKVYKWDACATPLDPTSPIIPGDYDSPKNEDHYENMKAQAYFRTAARFWKTYLAVTRGQRFPVADLVSLPSTLPLLHSLCMELAQPVRKTSKNGKTMVDKTPEGSGSPNLSDAVNMALNPAKPAPGFFDVD